MVLSKVVVANKPITLSQNYFKFQDKIPQPNKGISMGSPISSTIAEIFLHHLETKYVKQLKDTKSIVLYT
jgi:hypothetical protein